MFFFFLPFLFFYVLFFFNCKSLTNSITHFKTKLIFNGTLNVLENCLIFCLGKDTSSIQHEQKVHTSSQQSPWPNSTLWSSHHLWHIQGTYTALFSVARKSCNVTRYHICTVFSVPVFLSSVHVLLAPPLDVFHWSILLKIRGLLLPSILPLVLDDKWDWEWIRGRMVLLLVSFSLGFYFPFNCSNHITAVGCEV